GSSATSRIQRLSVEMKMQSAPKTMSASTPARRRRLPLSGFAGALLLLLTDRPSRRYGGRASPVRPVHPGETGLQGGDCLGTVTESRCGQRGTAMPLGKEKDGLSGNDVPRRLLVLNPLLLLDPGDLDLHRHRLGCDPP